MESLSNNTSRGSKKGLIAVIIVLIVGILAAGYFLYNQKNQIVELQEESLLTKQELEDEYESLSIQYEGFKMNLKNDSLLQQLDNEQAKVQRLLEELKTVKADNKAEIGRLKGELSSLRKILRHYVAQIDSLNRANEQLKKENKEITTKYQTATRTLSEVSKEKASLTEKVSLASKLDAVAINVVAANKKGKPQKKIKSVEQLIVSFSMARNITAEPGERTIYVRIMKPDEDVLVKSKANVFTYENSEVNYSMQRVIEYGGEEVQVTMYWKVEEYLMPGTYRVDIFADGNRIGSRVFILKD